MLYVDRPCWLHIDNLESTHPAEQVLSPQQTADRRNLMKVSRTMSLALQCIVRSFLNATKHSSGSEKPASDLVEDKLPQSGVDRTEMRAGDPRLEKSKDPVCQLQLQCVDVAVDSKYAKHTVEATVGRASDMLKLAKWIQEFQEQRLMELNDTNTCEGDGQVDPDVAPPMSRLQAWLADFAAKQQFGSVR
ncbi:unnamed protein product [Phytophthora lilii]|uniref:Unnamed protein product n=1 Tax=Phytophthora lilii TaxID=2077276 RepID=A0A9W6TYG3_9STRA|nr:unnamed protein product [Phytophthora lilii]